MAVCFLIVVNGVARLAGSVLHVGETGNYRPFSEYTILTATGGFDGTTFDGASSDFTFLDALLGYSANAVTLRLERNDIAFARVAATPNQRAVAGGLDSLSFGNALYDAVVTLDGPGARQAFEQLSGEVHASAATALSGSGGNVRSVVSRRFQAGFAPPLARTPGTPPGRRAATTFPLTAYASYGSAAEQGAASGHGAWGEVFGSWGRTRASDNGASLRHDDGGFLTGADGDLGEASSFGIFAGYSRSTFSAGDRASSGSSDNIHLGVHAGTRIGALRLNLGGVHSWHDISTRRAVAFAGFTDSLHASYRGRTAQVFGEAGYRFGTEAFSFEPFAGAVHVRTSTNRFTETGGAAALTAQRTTTTTTFSTLGLRAFSEFEMGGVPARLRGMVGWRHAFGDTTPVTRVSFAGGNSFSVTGTPLARDMTVVEAGLDLGMSEAATLNLSYDGEFSRPTRRHGFNARLQVAF